MSHTLRQPSAAVRCYRFSLVSTAASTKPRLQARILSVLFLAILFVTTYACRAQDASFESAKTFGFRIVSASVRVKDGIYLLDTDVSFQLSRSAREALSNGVPLTLYLNVRVMRERLLIDKEIFRTSVILRVETHPLSRQLVVTNSRSGTSTTYTNYTAMLEGIRQVRDIRLLAANALTSGEQHYVMVRASLDIEALPLPLRPVAYFSPDWTHSSEWVEVPL